MVPPYFIFATFLHWHALQHKNIQVKNIATIAKAALHKLLGKSSLNVRSVVDHDDSGNYEDH